MSTNNQRISKLEKNYIKKQQYKVASSDRFEDDTRRLKLEKNDERVCTCKENVKGFFLSTYCKIRY